jgi:hypothetical protein
MEGDLYHDRTLVLKVLLELLEGVNEAVHLFIVVRRFALYCTLDCNNVILNQRYAPLALKKDIYHIQARCIRG